MKNSTTNSERYTIRCAIYLFLIKDKKIFLVRRKNTGWEDGKYCVPGGHLDPDEKISEAVKREVEEEAGIKIDLKDLQLVHTMHRRANFDYIDLFFTANKFNGQPKNAEVSKADDVGWFALNNLPKNILAHQKSALYHYKEGVTFSEFGF